MTRPRNLLPFGWEKTYRWALANYDLVPFMYPTDIVEIPDEPGFNVIVEAVAGGTFWCWDFGIGGMGRLIDDSQVTYPGQIIPNIEMQVEIDGNFVTGNFHPWPYYLGLNGRRGFGPGWIIEKGTPITFHLRSVLPFDTDILVEEQVQVVAIGAQLAKLGAATYSEHNFRNMVLEDWDKITYLRPMSYSDKVEFDPMVPDQRVEVPTRIRSRNFLITDISVFAEQPDGNTAQTGPWDPTTNPPQIILSDEGGFWHAIDQNPSMSTMAAFQDGAVAPIEFRIPRFVPKNRNIIAILGGWPWVPSVTRPPYDIGIIYNGFEVSNDRREFIDDPPSADANPNYRLRRGAR